MNSFDKVAEKFSNVFLFGDGGSGFRTSECFKLRVTFIFEFLILLILGRIESGERIDMGRGEFLIGEGIVGSRKAGVNAKRSTLHD
jgi:hypothetical protein